MPLTADDVKIKRTYWGTGIADDIEQGAQNLMIGATTKVQEMAQDQEGVVDDALRLVGGGIKNVQAAAADQEGWGDDALRLIGGGIGNTLRVLGAAGEVGGWAGGKIAGAAGVDPRIGGAAGNIIGDALGGFGIGKLSKVAKASKLGMRASRTGKLLIREGAETVGKGLDDITIGAQRGVDNLLSPQMVTPEGLRISPNQFDLSPRVMAHGKTPPPLAKGGGSPRYARPVEQLATGKGSRTGKGGGFSKADIASTGLTKSDKTVFNKLKAVQTEIGAHHHIFDHDLAGQSLNRVDANDIVNELGKLGVRPGNKDSNLIMAFHEKSSKWINEMQDGIQAQRKAKGKRLLTQRELDDLTKQPRAKETIFRGSQDIPESARIGDPMFEKVASYDDYYSRWKKFDIDPKKLKMSPKNFILGQDHLEHIHGAYNQLPERKAILKLVESGEWRRIPPKEAAQKLAEVNRLQTNIAIKVSQYRLGLIKKHLNSKKSTAWITRNPKDIRKWMVNNPAEAATLGWGKKIPSLKQLKGNPGEVFETTEELRQIFNTSVGVKYSAKKAVKDLAIGGFARKVQINR